VINTFPSGGWVDSRGVENADKCAWLSSDAFNSGDGGCVIASS
jgi:hypothetical protein